MRGAATRTRWMNFDTLEFEEIAANLLARAGWAIKYIWSDLKPSAFKLWLSRNARDCGTDRRWRRLLVLGCRSLLGAAIRRAGMSLTRGTHSATVLKTTQS